MSTTKKEYIRVEDLPMNCVIAVSDGGKVSPGATWQLITSRSPLTQKVVYNGWHNPDGTVHWQTLEELHKAGFMWSGDSEHWYSFKYKELPHEDPNDTVGKYQAGAQVIAYFALRTTNWYDRAGLRQLKKELALRTSAELVVLGRDDSETVIPDAAEVFKEIHRVAINGDMTRTLGVRFSADRVYQVTRALCALRIPCQYGAPIGYLEGTGSSPHLFSALTEPQLHIRTNSGMKVVNEGEWIVEGDLGGEWLVLPATQVIAEEEGGK